MFINSNNVNDLKNNTNNKIINMKCTILTIIVCLKENDVFQLENKINGVFFDYQKIPLFP